MDEIDGATSAVKPRGRAKPVLLADRVYERLAARIAGGAFRANARLPAEHELAALLGVSRPVLRAALARLKEEGAIVSRQGAGHFVRDRAAVTLGFSPVETVADIQRCYEFRLTVEPDAAHLAACRRNAEALCRMEAALDLLKDATRRHRHREDADFAFHLAVAQAANNHYFASTLQALKDHIFVGMHMHGLSLLGASPKLETVLDEHRAIHHAISRGEADAARHAMRVHLEGSRDRLFEGRTLDLSLRA